MKGPLPLLLLIVGVSGVYSGHSLQYYQTVVSVPGHGLPLFMSVGFVDGIQITRCRSDVGRVVPVAPWMKKLEDPDYWEGQTWICNRDAAMFEVIMEIRMKDSNQTGGFHIIQLILGCEPRDDGGIWGYEHLGYDGKDFPTWNTDGWVYYPLTDQPQVSTPRWNIPEDRWRHRNDVAAECIHWLKIHIENGKEELERRVRPEVKVSDQNVNGVTKLHCQVYGFYPRDVDVKWQKNGTDVPLYEYEAKHVLPNSDGTYQTRVTVEVPAEDREGHSCHVDHASLEETLIVKWEPQLSSNTLWIVSGVIAGVMAIVAAVGFIIWRKRSGKETIYAPTDTSDKDGSSASSKV